MATEIIPYFIQNIEVRLVKRNEAFLAGRAIDWHSLSSARFGLSFPDEEIEQPSLRVRDRLRVGLEIDDGDGGTVRILLVRAAVHVGRPERESLAENEFSAMALRPARRFEEARRD